MPERRSLAATAASLVGRRVVGSRALGGGSLSEILSVTFEDGSEAVVKSGPAPAVEARMLDALGAAGVAAPRVLGVGDDALVIERLPAGGRLADAWSDLGTTLATLHRTHGEWFGWPDDYAFDRIRIVNTPDDDWVRFWAEQRLVGPAEGLPGAFARRIEAAARKLGELIPYRPAPALLHGDLWGGNVLVEGQAISGLIDPACYYGDREVDLAMLALFDTPGPSFPDAYGSLAPGAAERLPVYQLWPAIVHARLFGPGYHGLLDRLLLSVGA